MTASAWQIVRLGEIVELFDQRRVPLNSRQRQERRGEYPYYGAQGVIDHVDDFLFDGTFILVAEDGENLNSRKLPLALKAAGQFWVNNHAHVVRGVPDIVDDGFLLAALNHADIKRYVTGAAQPKLSQANLRLIEIALPPLGEQRRIAGILSAYDDLIENCERRIRVLDEMARALYREWFVLFRYPGHEKVPLVDSPLGRLPRSWLIESLEAGGGTIQDGDWIETKDQGGDDYRLLQISNVGVGNFVETRNYRYVTSKTFSRLRCTEVLPGDILVARMPTPIGRAWLVTPQPWRMITAVDVAIIRSDATRLLPSYLVRAWNDDANLRRVAAHASGTTRPRITRRELAALQFVIPPIALQAEYESRLAPAAALVENLRARALSLRRARDLLLPNLISGKLSVDVAA